MRYRIEEVGIDGEPLAPDDVAKKFVKSCGVLVRDNIPITVQEWNRPSGERASYVGNIAKDRLFEKLMVNFLLPILEVNPDDEERVKEELLNRLKKWALRKMAEQFKNWKKKLYNNYVKLDKTPNFDHGYAKIKHHWADFVAYKKSEAALTRSAINKKNAAKKVYHHNMGSAGYAGCMPKWEALEAQFEAAGIIPEPTTWAERARNWFYGHGGTLDKEGKAIYNQTHKDNPLLPINEIRSAVQDVAAGRFVPDRENDELTRALKNPEHEGRARGTPGSKPWKVAFPAERKRYPDKSHQRRKEREAAEKAAAEAEKAAAADRLRNVEEALKRQQDQIDRLSQQGTGQSQRHILEAAFDGSGPSNRKSSVASTQLQDGGDNALTTAPPKRYPVDDITESTPCELKVQVMNVRVTVAVGMAVPIAPNPTWHCSPVPQGYAVVAVDDVMRDYEELKLDHPAGEDRELIELGEVKGGTVLWPKEHIHLPNYMPPRPPTPQSNNPPSPPHDHSPAQLSPSPPHHSPTQPSPPPRQPSPSPEPQSQKRKRSSSSSSKSRLRSPKPKQSPLPNIPHKNMKPRPWEQTEEETAAAANAQYEQWKIDMANKKKPIEPIFPRTAEDRAAAARLKNQLHQPVRLIPDYERSITKSAEAKERRVGKEVAQLGQQKKQSVEPLKVYGNEVWSTRAPVERYDPNNDPEFIQLYGEAAKLHGLSIVEYMSRLHEFEGYHELAYTYRHGAPLVKPELVKDLPTKMRRLHNWYMQTSANSNNWIYAGFKQEHYGHGDGCILIEFSELFQLYQQDAIDKSIVSAYCL